MNYSTLYEFSVFDSWTNNFVELGIFLFSFALYKFSKPDEEKDNEDEFKGKVYTKYIFASLFAIWGLIFFIGEKYDLIKTMVKYHHKEYMTIEGYVTDYVATNNSRSCDTFKINNVEFKIGLHDSFYHGYKEKQMDGSVIKDSCYLKICYINNFDSFKIIKIEQKQ